MLKLSASSAREQFVHETFSLKTHESAKKLQNTLENLFSLILEDMLDLSLV